MKVTKLIFTISLIMFSILMFGMASPDHSESPKIDQLNPKDYIDGLKLKRLLDKIASQEWDYDIKVQTCESGGGHGYTAGPVSYRFKYYIKLPECIKKLSKFLKKNNISRKRPYYTNVPSWGRAELYKYIYNPKYSFSICLYLLTRQKGHWGPSVETLLPLIIKDKKMWDSYITHWTKRLMRFYSVKSAYYNSYPKELYLSLLPEKYRNQLKKNPSYLLNGFAGHVRQKNGKLIWGNRIKKKFIPFEKIIKDYEKDKSKVDFSKIAPSIENFKNWLQFIFNVDKEEMLVNLNVFLAYLRSQKEVKTIYPVSIMTLFIVKGYTFDPASGYSPNESTWMMLEYIVENPVQENAKRLRILMDGGNRKWIKDLMEKYNTTAKWKKYLN
jgi:hypothetical protein